MEKAGKEGPVVWRKSRERDRYEGLAEGEGRMKGVTPKQRDAREYRGPWRKGEFGPLW